MMKRCLLPLLAISLAFLFVGCEMLDERYVPLIDAIEQDDYKEALEILQDLMDVDPNSDKKPSGDKEAGQDSEGDNGGGFGNEETTGAEPDCVHDYHESGYDATCTSDGRLTRTCRKCGHQEEEALPALGHALREASCTASPKCSRCGQILA